MCIGEKLHHALLPIPLRCGFVEIIADILGFPAVKQIGKIPAGYQICVRSVGVNDKNGIVFT